MRARGPTRTARPGDRSAGSESASRSPHFGHVPVSFIALSSAIVPGFEVHDFPWIAAVLRTWEDRFGGRLLNVGPGAEIRLLVQRPSATREAAQRVAAEHYAFADECGECGRSNIKTTSSRLVDAPTWQFWWD